MSSFPPNDEAIGALVAAAKSGDTEAFENLFNNFHGAAIAVAEKIVGRDDAADVASDSWIKCHRHLSHGRFREGEPFAPWFLTIVKCTAIDLFRKRARQSRLRDDLTAEPRPEYHEDNLTARDDGRLVQAILSKLPPKQRAAVCLYHLGGFTQEEVAIKLATPLGTIKARIRRGIERMRYLSEAHDLKSA